MECSEARIRLAGSVDDELPSAERAALEVHLGDCAACRGERSGQWFVHRVLGREATRHTASPALRRRVRAALRAADGRRAGRWWTRWTWTLPVPALGAALAALLAANGAILATLHPSDDRVAEDVLAGHVRALVTSHPIDVASSDRHTVKPWYAGRLDFSPPVTDFAAEGFPLEGGRLDYVDGRTVAALVYGRREHRVDAFEWPAPDARAEPLRVEERRGFHLVHWTRGGMRYWLVSDLEAAEIERLARLLERAAQ